MKKLSLIFLSVISLTLAACDAPDIAGLNSMPERTKAMSDKMDTTNGAIHKQTLLLALVELNKSENQESIFPVPTGLMPAGKVFAEEAYPDELIELTYNELKKLEENTAVTGLDKDGVPVPLTEQEANLARRKKMAGLYSLMIIASFAQDEKIHEIIQHEILGSGRFQQTALAFLALREYFLREVLLKLSLKVDKDSAETLDNSGKMNEAIKYLQKLDYISRLDLGVVVQLKLKGEAAFLNFEENADVQRPETQKMWALALQKAQDGSKLYQANASTKTDRDGEIAAQNRALQILANGSR